VCLRTGSEHKGRITDTLAGRLSSLSLPSAQRSPSACPARPLGVSRQSVSNGLYELEWPGVSSVGVGMAKQWTFLVYLAGDNNLESFGQRDLQEMKTVGSTEDFNVVAQFDRMSDGVTRRY
jgi:hypothetical protein